jgi:7-cyano-7-deazaguanine synthase in queuosine biosynthesis
MKSIGKPRFNRLIYFKNPCRNCGKMKVIILLSGGLDSTIMIRIDQEKGDEIYALTFDYRQKHSVEIEAANTMLRH